MNDELIKFLKGYAESSCAADSLNSGEDVCVYDFCGGNVDDAFYSGEHSGEIGMARMILNMLGIEYTVENEEDD